MKRFDPLATITAPITDVVADPIRRPRGLRRRLTIVFVVFAGFMVLGNLAIVGASAWAQRGAPDAPAVPGVGNYQQVDERLSRGKAPTADGYRSLAGVGIRTIVDLRAEEGVERNDDFIRSLGMEVVHIPVRDGQSPSAAQVNRFLAVTGDSHGGVFVHCGAGVGRTGAMAAAWLVHAGEASGWSAMRRNLQVGPPSLEQLAFAAGLDGDELGPGADFDKPGALVVAVSRALDAPRRLWHNLGL
jgi:protein tyrosine phosphatase (PTP) superfamily phosphohydrolase (DUF442 family)